MNRLYFSEESNVYFNIALEDFLFQTANPSDFILFLWQNQKTVIIGRSQNVWKECDTKSAQKDDVFIARRETGGGAVFQDSGNLCFTFICGNHRFSKEKNTDFICNALKSFSICAKSTGRNDIEVNGFKVSGSAFRFGKNVSLHHGTLLVNTNLALLSAYLTPPQKKLSAKGIDSVRSRVENLNAFCKNLTVKKMQNQLANDFLKIGFTENKTCNIQMLTTHTQLNDEFKKMQSWDWIYGKTPEFTHCIEEHFDWGYAELLLTVKNGIIERVFVYTDSLNTAIPQIITQKLTGLSYQNLEITQLNFM